MKNATTRPAPIRQLAAALLASMFLCFVVVTTADAQTRYTNSGATSKFSIGLGFAPGIALPTGTLDDGDDAGLGFAWRGGVNITYPLSTNVSGWLNVGLDSRDLGVREDTLLDPRFGSFRYLFIQPGFSYSSIGLSVNIGLPMSGTEPTPRPSGSPDPETSRDIESENIRMLIEPRLSGILTLMNEPDYWLGLDVSVGFAVSKLYQDDFIRPEEVDDGRTRIGEGSSFTAHIGATFQFGIFDAF